MTKREAQALARKVGRASGCTVTGLRTWGRGRWAVEAVDTLTGIPFTVDSLSDWQERLRASGASEGVTDD